ncbi:tigger transposable element-derived protein 6-like [Montipora foliosa]|uniref:tigger transposable element-derived protein 6-like n=1 Tax=Montipora foliosa TaxID=591990 RepID=UPI0035F19FCD
MACCGNGIPERASNIPVDDPILVEQARFIAERFGEDTFKGTSGWLETWKKRHNIGQMSIAGEEGDVSPVTIDSWNERVKELTKGYSPRDVWNEDETGCFWKAMPEKSLSQKEKRCRSGKNEKQRITAVFFVNAEGEKEGLMVIGSSTPEYLSRDEAWMRTEIMALSLPG